MPLALGPSCCCKCCSGFEHSQDGCVFEFFGNESCQEVAVVSWKWEEINNLDPEDEYEEFSTEQNPEAVEFPLEGEGQIADRTIRLTETLANGVVCVYTKRVTCTCVFKLSENFDDFIAYIQTVTALRFTILPGDLIRDVTQNPVGCSSAFSCDDHAGAYTVPLVGTPFTGPSYYEFIYNYGFFHNICGAASNFSRAGGRIVINRTPGGAGSSVTITVDAFVRVGALHYSSAIWGNLNTPDCLGNFEASFLVPMGNSSRFESEGRSNICYTAIGGRALNVEFIV